ncbi:hypothetical protein NLC26_02650 [Candidatus Aminicenantes bacterium AC-708-M15]|jgi:galactokinase|nr:hypothetical protein [SCandidatus Aminicenantes bacterium Aminicenantia_JdfR_composite]MCP2597111.1 hypothetical protein [Candidatus Aminicenantes bacterium AC-335-G13]MCP2598236.1 hypothetical protein [Candidatus Aminicenantes bacterium AC-335-L06]MCP2598869.1 hypothetical protein [Candidatus Aminicenantes bacterium AC-335-B20]MCP2604361.1 hypothetical protein [Candidatus Aminicenantes bacterium AC-708-M15]MCP2618666.1 hypothetical protein [Candidatus Aminicenantes bacterium AC-335-A11]
MVLKVSAPGRICLFGEHQDYFGLSVIASAINLRISISGSERDDDYFYIDMPDIEEKDSFPIEKELRYIKERDYIRSTFNILKRRGIKFNKGWDCTIKGNIPINSGTASSSALVVAWTKFLLETVNHNLKDNKLKIAELAHEAEVLEFKEPGGKMDHYTSALGGILYIDFGNEEKIEKLGRELGKFVLADSLERKNTKGTLARIKSGVFESVRIIKERINNFDLKSFALEDANQEIEKLPLRLRKLLKGTMLTRDLTQKARTLFKQEKFDHKKFGLFLIKQQEILRNYLEVSTQKINKMIDSALKAGALGAKINGSGEGGCIFAYAPDKYLEVAEAIKRVGGKPFIISIDNGVRLES